MAEERRDREERGFAAMDEEKRREIASKGGKAAHEKGTAHEFTSKEAAGAGEKGGEKVSQDRAHMCEIGRKGSEKVSQDREHCVQDRTQGRREPGAVTWLSQPEPSP